MAIRCARLPACLSVWAGNLCLLCTFVRAVFLATRSPIIRCAASGYLPSEAEHYGRARSARGKGAPMYTTDIDCELLEPPSKTDHWVLPK